MIHFLVILLAIIDQLIAGKYFQTYQHQSSQGSLPYFGIQLHFHAGFLHCYDENSIMFRTPKLFANSSKRNPFGKL
jgi:hypothetical protein